MKKIKLSLFLLLMISFGLLAQVPHSFNYQAVLRDNAGEVMGLQDISVTISILKGDYDGSEVFTETHNIQTNEFGLINLKVGSINSLEGIEWGTDNYFIKISVDGNHLGTSQLLSVPYSLHSLTSSDTFSGDYNDLSNLPDFQGFVEISNPEPGDLLYYGDGEWQTLSIGDEGYVLVAWEGIPQWKDIEELLPQLYILSLAVDPEDSGLAIGAGEFLEGQQISLVALPSQGFEFLNWTDNTDEIISDEAIFSFSMPGNDVTLTANFEEIIPVFFNLSITVSPEDAGVVTGAGEYEEGEIVNLTATANDGFLFLNWTDEEDQVISTEASFDFTMPADDVTLTANFEADDQPDPDTVTDIDGNVYPTVVIGELRWMAENLRTTKYADGTSIPTGLSFEDWSGSTEGAYTIYPHENVEGIDSEAEMAQAYGHLYKWYAVNDSRGLCPAGWRVPTDDEWQNMASYVIDNVEFSDIFNVGNNLKDCRQVNSPLGGDCATNIHPRWNSHPATHGTNDVGLSLLPGGFYNNINGETTGIGTDGYFWTATEDNENDLQALYKRVMHMVGMIVDWSVSKNDGFSVRCVEGEAPPVNYTLSLEVNPAESGEVSGGGQYEEGEIVNLTATANDGFLFLNWTDEEDQVISTEANFAFTMPASDVTLTANFEADDQPDPVTVTDIDGNVYPTVVIGELRWMAKNLRTTKYADGNSIPTGLSFEDWSGSTEGAYAIYPHENVEGINSEAEMAEAYGYLYKWYAVNDSRGLCPAGWRVPTNDEWADMVDYVIANVGGTTTSNVGNRLKDCRQVNSPLGGDCATSNHPRWNANANQYGTDNFGLSLLPGGFLNNNNGDISGIGSSGNFWTATEHDDTRALRRRALDVLGSLPFGNISKNTGYSVRCVEGEAPEPPATFTLTLQIDPIEGGVVTGAGEYEEDQQVNLTAFINLGFTFENWTDESDQIVSSEAVFEFTMPAFDVILTANFTEVEPLETGTVSDQDGNNYPTIFIDNKEWMTENLRVTTYRNGDVIPADLDNSSWQNTTTGATAFYNDDNQLLNSYGRLYNWYAVTDSRGICPTGWHVPTEDEWNELTDYLIDTYDNISISNLGQAMKSCRQVNSPLGGSCNSVEHPRWDSHDVHFGTNISAFNGVPGGERGVGGGYSLIGRDAKWWSSTESDIEGAGIYLRLRHLNSEIQNTNGAKISGYSVRCVRIIED